MQQVSLLADAIVMSFADRPPGTVEISRKYPRFTTARVDMQGICSNLHFSPAASNPNGSKHHLLACTLLDRQH